MKLIQHLRQRTLRQIEKLLKEFWVARRGLIMYRAPLRHDHKYQIKENCLDLLIFDLAVIWYEASVLGMFSLEKSDMKFILTKSKM